MNTQEDNQTSVTKGSSEQTISVGRTLREAREQLGLSVGDVANRIKFAPRQIEWLEADDYIRLPEATFVRGFVRSYARLLDLDSASLLSSLPQSHMQSSATPEVKSVEIPMPTVLSARRNNIMWLVAALVVALVLVLFERTGERTPAEDKTVAKTTVEAVILPSGAVDKSSEHPAEQMSLSVKRVPGVSANTTQQTVASVATPPAPVVAVPPVARVAAPVAPAVLPVVPVQATAKPQPPVVVTAPVVQQPTQVKDVQSSSTLLPWPALPQKPARTEQASGQTGDAQTGTNVETGAAEHALRIEFDEEAWLEVKDGSDKVLIGKMFKAGSLVRAVGMSPLQVTIGNANAVRLFDNDKAVKLVPSKTSGVAKVKLN